jgi:hypothetical protein
MTKAGETIAFRGKHAEPHPQLAHLLQRGRLPHFPRAPPENCPRDNQENLIPIKGLTAENRKTP